MHDPASNLSKLSETPWDWEVRIVAIEDFVRVGEMDSAKRLVRDSPDDSPVPAHLQLHLHTMLTKGKAALPPLEEEVKYEPISLPEPANWRDSVNESSREVPEDESAGRSLDELAEDVDRNGAESEEVKKKETPPESSGSEFTGGLAALRERDAPQQPKKEAPLPKVEAIRIDREAARKRWDDYDGDLNLTVADYAPAPRKGSSAPERLSAVTLAIMFHLVLVVLVSLVVIHTPRPQPPQLVLSIPHEREVMLTTTRITKPTTDITPAAASAQAVNVLSSVGNSAFQLPEMEQTDNYQVNSVITGLQPTGEGMSFATQATKESNINFFGISGGGKKIVFVIDATPEMLIDEKGGMTAYDKVKDEVGVMLANLNRGTFFNILIYQGKRLVAFREKPVAGLPSNLRLAIEWMEPLNRDYDRLGLQREFGDSINVAEVEDVPIRSADVSHYTKAIQLALEWRVSAVFCISNGYARMNRSPTPEMLEKMKENPPTPGTPGKINASEQKAWQAAVAKTRAWLKKENAARAEKGVSPKVVTNFNGLVQQITGRTPPRRTGGTSASGGASMPKLPPVTPDEIEEQVKKLVNLNYRKESREDPSVHMVLFLAEDEKIGEMEKHFKNLTRKNRGKLKILNGLAALQDVTAE